MAVAFTGLGMLLGYAAASGKLNLDRWARAGQPAPTATVDQPAASVERPAACCNIANHGELVALAAHNHQVEAQAAESGKKPNILVIWGDDIGYWNVSAYNRGMMGYHTPNIDRLAK